VRYKPHEEEPELMGRGVFWPMPLMSVAGESERGKKKNRRAPLPSRENFVGLGKVPSQKRNNQKWGGLFRPSPGSIMQAWKKRHHINGSGIGKEVVGE